MLLSAVTVTHACILHQYVNKYQVLIDSICRALRIIGDGYYFQQTERQADTVANPSRGQLLNRGEKMFSLFPFATKNSVSRDRFDHPVPRQFARFPHPG